MRARSMLTRSSKPPNCSCRNARPATVLVARPRAEEVSAVAKIRDVVAPVVRKFTSVDEPTPARNCLQWQLQRDDDIGRSGYSRWRTLP